jgi:hypothetical protein
MSLDAVLDYEGGDGSVEVFLEEDVVAQAEPHEDA